MSGVRVLDDVVQERGGDRLLVERSSAKDLGDAERVVDELLARAALLALVRARRERERPRRSGRGRAPGLYGSTVLDQLVDEIFVPFASFEERHAQIVVPLPSVTVSPGDAGGAGFNAHTEK